MGLPEDLNTYKPYDALDFLETAKEILWVIGATCCVVIMIYLVLCAVFA